MVERIGAERLLLWHDAHCIGVHIVPHNVLQRGLVGPFDHLRDHLITAATIDPRYGEHVNF